MSAEDEIAALGRDLYHLGINSVAVPTKLHEMGWRKSPRIAGGVHVVPAASLAPMAQQHAVQIANPNQMIPRGQRWMQ